MNNLVKKQHNTSLNDELYYLMCLPVNRTDVNIEGSINIILKQWNYKEYEIQEFWNNTYINFQMKKYTYTS
jgi:hypothetical protein